MDTIKRRVGEWRKNSKVSNPEDTCQRSPAQQVIKSGYPAIQACLVVLAAMSNKESRQDKSYETLSSLD
ncbi:hypothetical protein PN499_17950 [Kamptonema animale CS-326]|uniref:hypothetical protein n=1 Tax=Kamptonema animale TaxID=92934 RepID=UPI00232C4E79|nr:hypothetical protein [Kamptonema animale]MDB9513078.1 hypothetical protein [Kamptonema animale CS-326]